LRGVVQQSTRLSRDMLGAINVGTTSVRGCLPAWGKVSMSRHGSKWLSVVAFWRLIPTSVQRATIERNRSHEWLLVRDDGAG
jgi:hypothetical protein